MKHYHDLGRKQVIEVASDQLRQLMLYMIDQSDKDIGQKFETVRFRSLRDLPQRRSHLNRCPAEDFEWFLRVSWKSGLQ